MCLVTTIFTLLFLIHHPFSPVHLHCLLLNYVNKWTLLNKRSIKGRKNNQNTTNYCPYFSLDVIHSCGSTSPLHLHISWFKLVVFNWTDSYISSYEFICLIYFIKLENTPGSLFFFPMIKRASILLSRRLLLRFMTTDTQSTHCCRYF